MSDYIFNMPITESKNHIPSKKIVDFKTWEPPKELEDEFKNEIKSYKKWAKRSRDRHENTNN